MPIACAIRVFDLRYVEYDSGSLRRGIRERCGTTREIWRRFACSIESDSSAAQSAQILRAKLFRSGKSC